MKVSKLWKPCENRISCVCTKCNTNFLTTVYPLQKFVNMIKFKEVEAKMKNNFDGDYHMKTPDELKHEEDMMYNKLMQEIFDRYEKEFDTTVTITLKTKEIDKNNSDKRKEMVNTFVKEIITKGPFKTIKRRWKKKRKYVKRDPKLKPTDKHGTYTHIRGTNQFLLSKRKKKFNQIKKL